MGYNPRNIAQNIAQNKTDAAEMRAQANEATNPRIARILLEAADALDQESTELEADAEAAEAEEEAQQTQDQQ